MKKVLETDSSRPKIIQPGQGLASAHTLENDAAKAAELNKPMHPHTGNVPLMILKGQ